jgi:acetyl esterase/lipase
MEPFMKYLLIALLLTIPLIAQEPDSIPKPDSRIGLWPDKPLLDKVDDIFEFKEKNKIWLIKKVSRPALAFYKAPNADKSAPAVMICPGGGYAVLAYDLEGTDIAKWLNSFGVHVFILKYTVPGNQRDKALMDAQRAMGIIRSKAADYGVDPKKIGILGFSAGGHLVANASTNYEKRAYEPIDAADKVSCRPDFSVLVYPAYIYEKDDKTKIAPEIVVNAKTPPAFIVQTLDDRRLVDSSFNYCRALKDAKVDAELHLFAKGGHGYGIRKTGNPVAQWTVLCENWIKGITK